MFSEGQSLYLQEVLGVTPGDLIRHVVATLEPTPAPAPANAEIALAILTDPMAPEERELLNRILVSAKLPEPQIIEALDIQQAPHAKHLLIFSGQNAGREGQTWQFPKLSEMLGAGPDVAAKKKQTWNLLQQLVKEL